MASLMDLVTTIKVSINSTASKTVGLVAASGPLNNTFKETMADGSSSGQADLVYTASDTLVSGADTTIDLLGALETVFGDELNFAKIKAIFIRNNIAVTGSTLIVGGAASNAFDGPWADSTDKSNVEPTGTATDAMWGFVQMNPGTGWTVDATHQNLKLEHDAGDSNDIDYDIVIIGTST